MILNHECWQDGTNMKEKISELVDNELSDLEHYRLIRTLENDGGLRGVWERYHLISTVIRNELDVMVSPALADRIAQGIREETPASAYSTYFSSRLPGYTRVAAGMAIAASVAAVAIFTLQPLSPPNALPSQIALQNPPPAIAAPAAVRPVQAAPQGTLNTYLVEHSEFTPNAGMNGMLSYVRVVGHGNNKRQSDAQ